MYVKNLMLYTKYLYKGSKMLERWVSNHSRKHYLQITAPDYHKETFFQAKGFGLYFRLMNFTEEEILQKIETIVSNPTYR